MRGRLALVAVLALPVAAPARAHAAVKLRHLASVDQYGSAAAAVAGDRWILAWGEPDGVRVRLGRGTIAGRARLLSTERGGDMRVHLEPSGAALVTWREDVIVHGALRRAGGRFTSGEQISEHGEWANQGTPGGLAFSGRTGYVSWDAADGSLLAAAPGRDFGVPFGAVDGARLLSLLPRSRARVEATWWVQNGADVVVRSRRADSAGRLSPGSTLLRVPVDPSSSFGVGDAVNGGRQAIAVAGSGGVVYGVRRIGGRFGTPRRISSSSSPGLNAPSVSLDGDGRAVAAWVEGNPYAGRLRARLINRAGRPSTAYALGAATAFDLHTAAGPHGTAIVGAVGPDAWLLRAGRAARTVALGGSLAGAGFDGKGHVIVLVKRGGDVALGRIAAP